MISVGFASLFVISQRVFQFTSFTFANPLFWRKEISDILSVTNVPSWLRWENQPIRAGAGELCKSFSAAAFLNKNQNNSLDFRGVVFTLPGFTCTPCYSTVNCWLPSQLWSYINSQGKLMTLKLIKFAMKLALFGKKTLLFGVKVWLLKLTTICSEWRQYNSSRIHNALNQAGDLLLHELCSDFFQTNGQLDMFVLSSDFLKSACFTSHLSVVVSAP